MRYKELLSPVVASCPFWRHNDLNRLQMVGKHHMQAQVPLQPDVPLVYTEHYGLFEHTAFKIESPFDAKVLDVFASHFLLENAETGERVELPFPFYAEPVVRPGDRVERGHVIAIHRAFKDVPEIWRGKIFQGKNVDVSFGFEDGYVYEDAIVADESVKETFASYMPDVLEFDLRHRVFFKQTPVPGWTLKPGVVAEVYEGSDLSLRFREATTLRYPFLVTGFLVPPPGFLKAELQKQPPKTLWSISKLQREAENGKYAEWRKSLLWSLLETAEDDAAPLFKVFGLQIQRVRLGDKFTNRHGNKGVISAFKELPEIRFSGGGFEGTFKPSFVLSPYGVARMNVGQLVEFHYAFLLKHVAPKVVEEELKLRPPVSVLERLIELLVTPVEPAAALDVIEQAKKVGVRAFLDFVKKHGLPVKILNRERADYYRKVLKLYQKLGLPYERRLGGKRYSLGVTYVHKLDLVAAEKIKAVAVPGVDEKGQRIGEQEHWALLAQGNAGFLEEVAVRGDKWGQVELARQTLFKEPQNAFEAIDPGELETLYEARATLAAMGVPVELKVSKHYVESYRRWRQSFKAKEEEAATETSAEEE